MKLTLMGIDPESSTDKEQKVEFEVKEKTTIISVGYYDAEIDNDELETLLSFLGYLKNQFKVKKQKEQKEQE